MKTFTAAVVVAVVLTFICIQESSALPDTEVKELDHQVAEHAETSEDSWMMPLNREKRDIKCRFCCESGGCGVCCRF